MDGCHHASFICLFKKENLLPFHEWSQSLDCWKLKLWSGLMWLNSKFYLGPWLGAGLYKQAKPHESKRLKRIICKDVYISTLTMNVIQNIENNQNRQLSTYAWHKTPSRRNLGYIYSLFSSHQWLLKIYNFDNWIPFLHSPLGQNWSWRD